MSFMCLSSCSAQDVTCPDIKHPKSPRLQHKRAKFNPSHARTHTQTHRRGFSLYHKRSHTDAKPCHPLHRQAGPAGRGSAFPGRRHDHDADSHLPQAGEKLRCSVHRPRTSERSPARCRPPRPGPAGSYRGPALGPSRSAHKIPPAVTCRNSPRAGRCWGARILPGESAVSTGCPLCGQRGSAAPAAHTGGCPRSAASSGRLCPPPPPPATGGGGSGSAQSGVGPAGAAAPQAHG